MAMAQWCIGAFFAAVVGMILVTVWLVGQARQRRMVRQKIGIWK